MSAVQLRFARVLAVFALGGGTIVTGLVAEGCSSGGESQYRCDTTGCFECDGYGCSPIPAPTVTPCTLPDDPKCSTTSTATKCTDLGCLGVCKADADCPRGTVCRGKDAGGEGFCAAPTGKDPTIVTCTVAADCGPDLGRGKACVDSKCVDAPPCVGAACECKYSSDCGDGRICVDSTCTTRCDAASGLKCPSGSKCGPLGTCTPDDVPTCGSAAAGATCKSGEHCFDGHCTGGCAIDGDCKTAAGTRDPGLKCVAGACAPNESPVTNCTATAECAGSQKCLDGFCRFVCANDDECKSHDARIGACAVTEGVCRAPADVAAKCTSKSDCGPSLPEKDCVDGACE